MVYVLFISDSWQSMQSIASECFLWTNLTITCWLLLVLTHPDGSLWHISISYGFKSIPDFLQMFITFLLHHHLAPQHCFSCYLLYFSIFACFYSLVTQDLNRVLTSETTISWLLIFPFSVMRLFTEVDSSNISSLIFSWRHQQ